MEGSYHEFDPDGDVLLILRDPNAPFAVWEEQEKLSFMTPPRFLFTDAPGGTEQSLSLAEKKCSKGRKKKKGKTIAPPSSVTLDVEELSPKEALDPAMETPVTEDTLKEDTGVVGEEEPGELGIRLRVSSRHLILASTYFRNQLSWPWTESTTGADGCRYIYSQYWDKEALAILMHAIHGRTRSVPRVVSLEMLAKIALLVDYYKCHEVIEVFSDMWIQKLRNQIPVHFDRDLVLWVFISYVFIQDDIFKDVTRTAIERSPGEVPSLGLPIPSVIEKLNCRRLELINRILIQLRSLLEHFRENYMGCSFECSSILLGALTKEMHANGLPPGFGAFGATERSLADTINTVRKFQSPEWGNVRRKGLGNTDWTRHSCALSSFVEEKVIKYIKVEGLSLSSFRAKPARAMQAAEAATLPENMNQLQRRNCRAADQVQTHSCGLRSSYSTPPAVPQHLQGALYFKPGATPEQNNAARGRNASAVRNDICEACRRPRSSHPAGTTFKPVQPWRDPAGRSNALPAPRTPLALPEPAPR